MDELSARLDALTERITRLEGTLEGLDFALGEQIERLGDWNELRRREIAVTQADLHDVRSELLSEVDRVRTDLAAAQRRRW